MKNTKSLDIKDLEMVNGGEDEQIEITPEITEPEVSSVDAAPVRRQIRRKRYRQIRVNGQLRTIAEYYTVYAECC